MEKEEYKMIQDKLIEVYGVDNEEELASLLASNPEESVRCMEIIVAYTCLNEVLAEMKNK